jgi:Bacterial mobilisation protein (MobC)
MQHLEVNSCVLPDSLSAAFVSHFTSMVADSLIAARVTADMKQAFAAVAQRQDLSESTLLKRLIEASLVSAGAILTRASEPIEPVINGARVSVRLRADDLLLLRERARARQIPTGTYASLLIRAHLRTLTPLPTAELTALKGSVAELGAIGRNLNQIARSLNQGNSHISPGLADLRAVLKALWGLRDHTKALITANLESWRIGYEKAPH